MENTTMTLDAATIEVTTMVTAPTISYVPVVKQFTQRDEQWVEIARNLERVQTARKELEAEEKFWAEELKNRSEGHSSQGGDYFYEKTIRKGVVNYKIIPELHGIDLEKYRGSSAESWKLTKK